MYFFTLQIWGIFFLVVMTTSITSQVLLTLPEFRVSVNSDRNLSTITNPKMMLFFATGLYISKPWELRTLKNDLENFRHLENGGKDLHIIEIIRNCEVLLFP